MGVNQSPGQNGGVAQCHLTLAPLESICRRYLVDHTPVFEKAIQGRAEVACPPASRVDEVPCPDSPASRRIVACCNLLPLRCEEKTGRECSRNHHDARINPWTGVPLDLFPCAGLLGVHEPGRSFLFCLWKPAARIRRGPKYSARCVSCGLHFYPPPSPVEVWAVFPHRGSLSEYPLVGPIEELEWQETTEGNLAEQDLEIYAGRVDYRWVSGPSFFFYNIRARRRLAGAGNITMSCGPAFAA